jgi:hypothetical protein
MNRLRIILNNRRRFVFLAAMAAVLVLLAGGANALGFAAYTVRCVPSHTINSSCTATDYLTIQAAVNAANSGDTILVAPGTYHETVTIDETGHSRDHLSLLGAQAGNDARADRHDSTKESIVDATGKGNSAIIVEVLAVVIDGFTVQGGTQGNATGIDLKGTCSTNTTPANGGIVVNNILTNNATGVSLNSEGCGTANTWPPPAGAFLVGALVEHNLFKNNNAGPPSSGPGNGVYTTGVQHAIITENAFYGNKTSALGMNNADDVTIMNNTSEKDGSFVIFTGTTNAVFSNNRGEDFGAKGVLPGAGDAAVAIGPGNQYLVISDNCLEEGKAPISNGIAFTSIFGPGTPNTNIYVKNNRIKCFPGTGILAEVTEFVPALPPPTLGTLTNSLILGNEVEDNGLDGIYLDGAVPFNAGNQLFDNEAEGNHRFDCHDDTTGPGTANTANTWFHNTGNLMYPTGLCTPEKRHDHDWR